MTFVEDYDTLFDHWHHLNINKSSPQGNNESMPGYDSQTYRHCDLDLNDITTVKSNKTLLDHGDNLNEVSWNSSWAARSYGLVTHTLCDLDQNDITTVKTHKTLLDHRDNLYEVLWNSSTAARNTHPLWPWSF